MLCGDVSDQLLDQYRFTYSGTSEQTDLTALRVWSQKVNNFDSCLKDLNDRTLVLK